MTAEDLNPHKLIPTPGQESNLEKLALVLSNLETIMDRTFIVSSGLRSPEIQALVNPGVKNSAHETGEAADIADCDHSIYDYLFSHQDIVEKLDLYIENKAFCKNWCHTSIRPTPSGNRFFIP